ncbi:MAG: 7-cyano-7-deazaguanine synthase QueC [Alphaproteobacteria bacterium]|nr:7-cyano-7-deazaguanine synthase QueC [Alphaproteobacteria bacterium]
MLRPAVVLLSGGLDSTTCLGIALDLGFSPIAVSFRYGQRHVVELEAARRVAAHYGVKTHFVFDVGLFSDIGRSALTDPSLAVPRHRDEEAMESSIPITYVPARNLVFLSYAVGVAETHEARDLFIGVNALDYSGYPDCRPEFVEAFQRAANLATKAGVEGKGVTVHAPLVTLHKSEIIRRGMALGVPYHLTHSCYSPLPDGRSCGSCDSCLLRLKGFREAGCSDPIPYAEVA